MLEQRHRDEAFDTEVPAAEEARIRADERRRVLAEMAGHDGAAPSDVDWRTAPPPFGEAPAGTEPTTQTERGPDDPRRWDIPDDRWDEGHRDDRLVTNRTDTMDATDVGTVRTDQVPLITSHGAAEETVVERGWSPGQLLLALAGACALTIGIVAVVRTGIDAPLAEPVAPVLGWDHTALLGLFEIGAGAVLLLASLRPGLRWLGGLCGLALIAGGVLIVVVVDGEIGRWIADELGAERTFGWVAIATGAVAVLGALIPRTRRHVATSPAS